MISEQFDFSLKNHSKSIARTLDAIIIEQSSKSKLKMEQKSITDLLQIRRRIEVGKIAPTNGEKSRPGAPNGRQTDFAYRAGVTLGGPRVPIQQQRRTVFTAKHHHWDR